MDGWGFLSVFVLAIFVLSGLNHIAGAIEVQNLNGEERLELTKYKDEQNSIKQAERKEAARVQDEKNKIAAVERDKEIGKVVSGVTSWVHENELLVAFTLPIILSGLLVIPFVMGSLLRKTRSWAM